MTCCDEHELCNQGRNCPVRTDTHRVLYLREADVTLPDWQELEEEGLGWLTWIVLAAFFAAFVITASGS